MILDIVGKSTRCTDAVDAVDLVWGVIDFTPDTDFPMVRAKNVIASPLGGGVGVCPSMQAGLYLTELT